MKLKYFALFVLLLFCAGGLSAQINNPGTAPQGPVTGQFFISQHNAVSIFQSAAVSDSVNSPVTSSSYTIACDTSSAVVDRGRVLRLQSGASAVTVPLSTATGCSGMSTKLIDDGAGAVTVSATSTDTFSIYDGVTRTVSATSFTLATGQSAVVAQAATGIWEIFLSNGNSSQANGGSFPVSEGAIGTDSGGKPIASTGAGLAVILQSLSGCNTATYVLVPQGSDCVAQSGGGSSTLTPVNLTPASASANSTSAQQLQEVAIPSAYFNTANAVFTFDTAGNFASGVAQTPTLTFAHKLCTVSGCGSGTVITLDTYTTGAITTGGLSGNGWRANGTIGTAIKGTSGQFEVHGTLTADTGATPATAAAVYTDENTALSSAINLTGALYFDTFVTTSTGNTSNVISQRLTKVFAEGDPIAAITAAVSPSTASVATSATQAFTITMGNDFSGQGVTWALSGAGCSGSTCGTLSSVTTTSVTYTGPGSVPSPATVTLTATSIADTSKTGTATITVTATGFSPSFNSGSTACGGGPCSGGSFGTGSSLTVTLATSATGEFAVCLNGSTATATQTLTCSDSDSDVVTYPSSSPYTDGSYTISRLGYFALTHTNASEVFTCTITNPASYQTCVVAIFSGVPTGGWDVALAGAANASGSSWVSGTTASTANASELAVGGFISNYDQGTVAGTGGYTFITKGGTTGFPIIDGTLFYKVLSSTGTQQLTGTVTNAGQGTGIVSTIK